MSKSASDFYFILKGEKMSKSYSQRSNDQKSNTKNPNNPAYKKTMDNRANQLLILTTLDTRVSKK
ncbi:hypothetical protein VN0510_02560 [Helicobacter pylori]